MRREHPRVVRTRRGDYRLRLPAPERQALRSLPTQLRAVIDGDDPVAFRLFPPAYGNDTPRNEEYDRLVRQDLAAGRMDAVRIMEETLDADRLTEEQLAAWLGAVNDVRLVLGTRLDVTEELYDEEPPDDHPDAPAFALYFYLGWLQEQIVDALSLGLPPVPPEEP